MLFLSSLTIQKTHRYFLLLFLMTGIFSSSIFVHAIDPPDIYYQCSGKEMIGIRISLPLNFDISFNRDKPTTPSYCHGSKCVWIFWEKLARGGTASPYPNSFTVKNKNGDGIKFKLKLKENTCTPCLHSDFNGSIACSDHRKEMFMGALITHSRPIGKGLKVTGLSANNKPPSNKDSLYYDLTITP